MEQTYKKIEERFRYIMERTKWIKETKAIVSKEENAISVPLINDLNQVGNIHSLFTTYCKGRKMMMKRKQLIFIMLYFFSPNTLGGCKMRRGLRKKIAKALNCTCSNISHDYKDISFYYLKYRSFRTSVNEIIKEILTEIEDRDGGS